VRFLLENGADWDTGMAAANRGTGMDAADRDTCMVHAAEQGLFKIVRSLVEHGADVKYRGTSFV
jgi:hypothetical protein